MAKGEREEPSCVPQGDGDFLISAQGEVEALTNRGLLEEVLRGVPEQKQYDKRAFARHSVCVVELYRRLGPWWLNVPQPTGVPGVVSLQTQTGLTP
jgi:hypothetical protein